MAAEFISDNKRESESRICKGYRARICQLLCFYDAFSSGPGAAIFLVDVEEVFFVPWPQNLSQTTREKVKVGFAK